MSWSWSWFKKESPYTRRSDRLADVIAAIQAAATYKFYQLRFDGESGWAWRINGDRADPEQVQQVFAEHPEFFRIDSSGKGSLVWRRQHRKIYDVDRGEEISPEAYEKVLIDKREDRVSRAPLNPAEVQTLITAAIEIHQAALEHARARRWWVTPLTAFGGALVGGLVALLG